MQPQEFHAKTGTNNKDFFWIACDKMSKEGNSDYADMPDFLIFALLMCETSFAQLF